MHRDCGTCLVEVSLNANNEETIMSTLAQDLFELQRIAHSDDGATGSLTDHLLHEVAAELIAGEQS